MNKVENVRIRDPGGRCDGALARLVVGRVRIRVEGDHTRREGKRGPICLTDMQMEQNRTKGGAGFLPVLNEGRHEAFYSRCDTYDKYTMERQVS